MRVDDHAGLDLRAGIESIADMSRFIPPAASGPALFAFVLPAGRKVE
jgi:hypothetical protein